jgi:hypothetical protein
LRSSRSSNSAESFSSPPSCLYACVVVAIFFGFVTTLRDAQFVAHGIANVRDVLGWGVQWWMIWLHSVWLLSHVLCPRTSLVTQHSLDVPASEWSDPYVARIKISGYIDVPVSWDLVYRRANAMH